jgi:ribonuclease R
MTEEPSTKTPQASRSFDPQQPASLLGFFETVDRPLSLETLADELDVVPSERPALEAVVAELAADGRIVATRDGRYGMPQKMNLVVGKLTCHEKGFGFVIPRDRTEKDLYIPSRKLGDGMHGDLVIARREATRGDRTEGRVIRLLRRARTQVVGTFELGKHFGFVVPLDPRIGYQVYVPQAEAAGAKDGQLVSAAITSYPERNGRRNPEGRVVEVLGDADDPRIDVEVIIREYGLPYEFPAEVMAEAEAIPTEVGEADIAGRTDFRELPVVTIDGENAKDFDDAVYVEKLAAGSFRLAVHIADVSAYVPVGSAIDREARLRATSVYFPDRVVPMLPERLSNETCSLKPGVDRLVQTVIMEINREGRTVDYEFHDGVIRSAERMTYKAVAALVDGSDPALAERYADHVEHFQHMGELCEVLRKYRKRRGSIDFDLPEPELLINLRGEVEDIFRSERNLAHRIIEEFMIRANEVVASHLTWEDRPALYRVHEGPDLEKVEAFREFIGGLGLGLGGGKQPSPRDFQRLVEHLEGQPGERVLIYLMLRTMKQAVYQPENSGHFGLASERYTHFTSPIRRYPDLVIHRLLKIERGSSAQQPFDVAVLEGELRQTGSLSSERERNAEEAERTYVDWKTVQFMADKVGDTFEALITGVHAYGFFVELERFFVEGLVHVSSLDDDYYKYDDKQHTLRGESKGRTLTLGSRVRVQLAKVDKGRRRLDFALEEGPLEAGIKPTKATAPDATTQAQEVEDSGGRRRKRRRRRTRKAGGQETAQGEAPAEAGKRAADKPADKREDRAEGKRQESGDDKGAAAAKDAGADKKAEGRGKRGRRGRRGRGSREAGDAAAAKGADGGAKKKKTTRSRRKKSSADAKGDESKRSTGERQPRSGKKTAAKRQTSRKRTPRKTAAQKAGPEKKAARPAADKPAEAGKPADKQRPKVNPYLTDL